MQGISGGNLPGAEFVGPGLLDLQEGRISEDALAVLAAAPRLRRSGVAVPEHPKETAASMELYQRLAARLGDSAHGRHHAIMRRVASYATAHARSGRR